MPLRLVDDERGIAVGDPTDPRDPELYRSGLSSARAALRAGVARRHEREVAQLEAEAVDPLGADPVDAADLVPVPDEADPFRGVTDA